MFVYNVASASNVSTNASANTDTDHLRYLTVTPRPCCIRSINLMGKDTGATSLTGIAVKFKRFATASTSGTGVTPQPRDPLSPAAKTTPFTTPTIGATPTVALALGFGRSGPGGWVAQDRDSEIQLDTNGGANGNLDMISQSGGTSLPFEYSIDHAE